MIRTATPLLALFALAALGCGGDAAASRSDNAPKGPAPEVPQAPGTRVEIATVSPSQARLTLELPGEVEGAREAMLSASMGGFVERVYADEGQTVGKGKVLAEVDTSLRAVAVETADAQLAQAQDDLDRIEKLGDLATPSQLGQARTQVKVADANLRTAKIQLSRTRITAPFAGVIAARDLEVGEVANPGSPAFRLVQLHPAIVNLSVSDRDVVALKEGMEVTVISDARLQPLVGKLKRILPAGNLKTRTFEVEVEVSNKDHSLLPGMIASASVSEVVATDSIVLPQDFLVTRLDGLGVYVDDGGKAAWRPVTVRSIVRDQAVIETGVHAGDRVVVVGHRDLAEGDPLLLAREGACCTNGRATF
ncbi:MAG: efflux RND transporter periplasmic adaptor subunit [Deltaproteobacteria bacterium]|nr:efflux RND transporter periplasmic adaptor subunit [Deltaproteobacteria bacterium]